jgi:hypothetical protein
MVEHPLLRVAVGRVSPVWVLGLAANALASKWATTVVVADLLVSMLHQNHESARAVAGTAEGEALARKLDALGHSLRAEGGRAKRG